MSKIKTREKGKDIKVLDKSAVVGQRMKNAFIRSKRNAAALMDNRQTTPSEYAEDKLGVAADNLAMIRRMWPCPGQKRRYAKAETCSNASWKSGRQKGYGGTPASPNRPLPQNHSMVWPRKAGLSHGMSAQQSGHLSILMFNTSPTPQAPL